MPGLSLREIHAMLSVFLLVFALFFNTTVVGTVVKLLMVYGDYADRVSDFVTTPDGEAILQVAPLGFVISAILCLYELDLTLWNYWRGLYNNFYVFVPAGCCDKNRWYRRKLLVLVNTVLWMAGAGAFITVVATMMCVVTGMDIGFYNTTIMLSTTGLLTVLVANYTIDALVPDKT